MNPNLTLKPASFVQMETFEGGGLIFNALDLKCLRLNSSAASIFRRLGSGRTVKDMIMDIASESGCNEDEIEPDIHDVLCNWIEHGILLQGNDAMEEFNRTGELIANPDIIQVHQDNNEVVLRHCETGNQLKLNSVGCLVWTTLQTACTVQIVIDRVITQCSDVPEKEVGEDVMTFISRMIDFGFVGEVIQ